MENLVTIVLNMRMDLGRRSGLVSDFLAKRTGAGGPEFPSSESNPITMK